MKNKDKLNDFKPTTSPQLPASPQNLGLRSWLRHPQYAQFHQSMAEWYLSTAFHHDMISSYSSRSLNSSRLLISGYLKTARRYWAPCFSPHDQRAASLCLSWGGKQTPSKRRYRLILLRFTSCSSQLSTNHQSIMQRRIASPILMM